MNNIFFRCIWVLLSALFTSIAVAQTSADADWQKVVDAAKKEGKVVLYANPAPAVLERIKVDFMRAYPGIDLEYSRITVTSQVAITAEKELQSSTDGGDVFINTDGFGFESIAKRGLLKPPAGPSAKAWPPAYLLWGVAPVLALEPLVIAYNSNLVKFEIKGYQDLLRPEFKGRLATTEVVSTTSVAWYDWLEKTQGAGFLARFIAQSPRGYVGTVPSTQAAVSGEVAANAYSLLTVAFPLIEVGAPIKAVIPSPSFGLRYVGIIAGWSKRPNAAAVLMNYLTSTRGQTTWNGRGETASPLPNIPGSLDVRTVHPFDGSSYKTESINLFKEKWDRIQRGK